MIGKIKDSLKYITFKDFLDIFIFILLLLPTLFYKLYLKARNKKIWLICEGKKDARDNGYVLFQYIREKDKDLPVYYAIDKKCPSYDKVKKYGNIISFGSLKHWIYYMSASKNISIHKSASPNEKIFYVLHYYKIVNGHRIFLQHGVTMNNVSYLHYKKTNFELFICGAAPEYKYILENFGYPSNRVCYLGFPRFDRLWNRNINPKQIVLMPTWRSWLGRETNALISKINFEETEYYKVYQGLLTDSDLLSFLEEKNITFYFYPHSKMEKYIHLFQSTSPNIKIVNAETADIQDLIAESALMITDYSSVSIDFAYMKKPLIYYQFDQKEFRENHLQVGYFSYEKMGFGPVLYKRADVIQKIKSYVTENYTLEENYAKNIESFFTLRDSHNCERIYKKIAELDQ